MAPSRCRVGRRRRSALAACAARQRLRAADAAAPDGLLQQIVDRLQVLQDCVDGLGVSVREIGGRGDRQEPAKLLPFAERQHHPEAPCCLQLFGEEQASGEPQEPPECLSFEMSQPGSPSGSESELSEDVLNPMPLAYLAPYPSLTESGCGSPPSSLCRAGTAEEKLLRSLLPALEALQASAGCGDEVEADAAAASPVVALMPGIVPVLEEDTLEVSALAPLPALPPQSGDAALALAVQPGSLQERARSLARRAARASSRARTASLFLDAVWSLLQQPCEGAAVWPPWLLAALAPTSRAWAVAAACERLEHHLEPVRRGAMRVVTRMEEPKSNRALELVKARLGHSDAGVRADALKTYARLAHHAANGLAPKTLIRQVCDMLADGDEAVRNEAVSALTKMVDGHDDDAITEILDHAKSEDASVRCAAVKALGAVAERGDEAVVSELIHLACKDTSLNVKDEAWLVLSHLVHVGDAFVIQQAMALTYDAEPAVVCEALRAIGSWTQKTGGYILDDGNSPVIMVVTRCLEAEDRRVREAATQALRNICARGHEYALTEILGYLKSGSYDTKLAALDAVADLGFQGDDSCIQEVKAAARADPRLMQRVTGVLCLLSGESELAKHDVAELP